MASTYAQIVNTLELTAGLPESSARYSADDMLEMVNKSLQQNIVPQLIQLNEEYLLTKTSLPLVVNGVRVYPTGFIPIPNRAYGQTIRAISFKYDGSSNATVTLPYIEVAQLQTFNRDNTQVTNGAPLGYHFLGNGVQLVGDAANFTGTIVLHYLLEPSALMSTAVSTSNLTSLTFSGGQLVVTLPTASIGAALGTYIPNAGTKLLDLVHIPTGTVLLVSKPALRADSMGTTTLTFTVDAEITADKVTELNLMKGFGTTSFTDIAVTPAGQSTITNLPKEYDNLLILDVAKRIWASLGDIDKASQFAQLYSETRDRLTSAMGSRSKGETKTVTNRNGILSQLRGRVFLGRR